MQIDSERKPGKIDRGNKKHRKIQYNTGKQQMLLQVLYRLQVQVAAVPYPTVLKPVPKLGNSALQIQFLTCTK
jgi:hypothetical protein